MPKATDDNTTSPDAQLLRACAAFWEAQQRLDHLQATSPRAPLGDPRTIEYEGQIEHVDDMRSAAVRDAAKLPALTPEGLRAKAAVARTAMMGAIVARELDPEEELGLSVLDDIANAGGLVSGSASAPGPFRWSGRLLRSAATLSRRPGGCQRRRPIGSRIPSPTPP